MEEKTPFEEWEHLCNESIDAIEDTDFENQGRVCIEYAHRLMALSYRLKGETEQTCGNCRFLTGYKCSRHPAIECTDPEEAQCWQWEPKDSDNNTNE